MGVDLRLRVGRPLLRSQRSADQRLTEKDTCHNRDRNNHPATEKVLLFRFLRPRADVFDRVVVA